MSAPETDGSAIRQTIRALRAAGYTLETVADGEEDIPVRTEAEALDAIMAVDDAYLFVGKAGSHGSIGWVRFVLGNDPEEVICDHTVNLSDALDPLMQRWEG